jgi:hypothetical protein
MSLFLSLEGVKGTSSRQEQEKKTQKPGSLEGEGRGMNQGASIDCTLSKRGRK